MEVIDVPFPLQGEEDCKAKLAFAIVVNGVALVNPETSVTNLGSTVCPGNFAVSALVFHWQLFEEFVNLPCNHICPL